jgi:ketosteroid isomerase-like protein
MLKMPGTSKINLNLSEDKASSCIKKINRFIMKNKIVTAGLLMALVTVFMACNRDKDVKTETPAMDKEQIKAQIQERENHFALIYNNRNADSLSYYADDAVSYFDGQKPIAGKAAIHQFIDTELKSFPKGAKISFETDEIYIGVDGRFVLEIGSYKQVDSTGLLIHKGHYFSLFEKRNGNYVCIRDMANSNPIEE